MKDILLIAAPFIYTYIFYLGFLIYAEIMNYGWTKLPLFLKILLVPPGVVFLVMDAFFNATAGIALFLQLPTKTTWTLSKRMAANIQAGPGVTNRQKWQFWFSSLIVNNMLIRFTKFY